MSCVGDNNAPLTDPTVAEEQTHSANHPYQPTPSQLPFGHQEEWPSSPTAQPFLPSTPLTLQPPPATTAASVTVLLKNPSELAALKQVTRYLVLLPKVPVTPTEEVCHNHRNAEFIGGWGWWRGFPCEDFI